MCYFLHRWIDFRKAEVEACASVAGVHAPVWRGPFGSQPLSPFWYLQLPSDAVAAQIADRALLIKVRCCYCSPCSRMRGPALFAHAFAACPLWFPHTAAYDEWLLADGADFGLDQFTMFLFRSRGSWKCGERAALWRSSARPSGPSLSTEGSDGPSHTSLSKSWLMAGAGVFPSRSSWS